MMIFSSLKIGVGLKGLGFKYGCEMFEKTLSKL